MKEGPLESFTLITAIGAVTERPSRMGDARPNFSRNPLSWQDARDAGSAEACACSGRRWLKPEYEAYDVPFIDDHDERMARRW